MTVYIILPILNRLQHTMCFLTCLEQQSFTQWKLILVDDGSDQDTQDYLKNLISKYPDKCKLLHGNGNWWWAHSLNQGLKLALQDGKDSDFILTANNDVAFLPDFLESLVETASKHQKSIVGSPCSLRSASTTSTHLGFKLNLAQGGLEPIVKPQPPYLVLEVDALSTRGTIFPIELFKKIGGFDEFWLPHHGADVDFTYRAKKAGYKLLICPKAVIEHREQNFERDPNPINRLSMLFSRRSSLNLRTNLILRWRFSDTIQKKILNCLRVIKNSAQLLSNTNL